MQYIASLFNISRVLPLNVNNLKFWSEVLIEKRTIEDFDLDDLIKVEISI